jgi:hypothetical protein
MGESIQEMFDKFKFFIKDDAFFYSAVIVLVAIVCFGLGRWSVSDSYKNNTVKGLETIKLTQPASVPLSQSVKSSTSSVTSTVGPVAVTERKYVGSKSGTKYHLLTCAGAKTIKETNKIYFSSKEDAQKQGYSPAGNCKGI